jgi:PAS domain S-box-containing protein
MPLAGEEAATWTHLVRLARIVARLAATTVTAMGVAVLVGWATNVAWLKSPIFGFAPMVPNTALNLILTALALGLSVRPSPPRRLVGQALALAGAAFETATLLQGVVGRDFGLDRLFFDVDPARPATASSVALIFFDVALLLLDVGARWRIKPSEVLAAAATILGWLVVGGFLLGAIQFSSLSSYPHASPMALPTALSVIVLGLGVMSARPDSGAMAVFMSRYPGGHAARRMLFVAVSLPVIGYLAVRAQRSGLYQAPGASVVASVAGMVAAIAITLVVGGSLDRSDARRRRVEAQSRVFSALIDNSSDFIGIADPNGKPVYVNPAGRRMVGLDPHQPVENTQIPEYYPPDVRPFATDVIVKAMVEEGYWQGETYFRNWQTQASIPVSDTHFMIRDPDTSRVLGMATITRDITDLRRAQEEIAAANEKLERTEATFRGIIELAGDAIISIDQEQRIMLFNKAAEQIFGWTRDEVVNRPFDVLLPERFRDGRKGPAEKLGADDVSAQLTGEDRPGISGLRKNGEEFPAEAAVSTLDIAGARLFTVVLRDITERRRVEREQRLLAEAGATLGSTLERQDILGQVARLAVRGVADVCIVDLVECQGQPPALEAACSDPAKEPLCNRVEKDPPAVAATLLATKAPSLLPNVPREFLESVASDAEQLDALGRLDLRSAMNVPILAGDRVLGSIFFGLSRSGRCYGPPDVGLAEELARRVSFALENARLYQLAQLATRAREKVLGVVAHDLRNPASTIVMQADLLRRRAGGPDQIAERADSIDRAAQRMLRLIQDLLDVRRMEAGKLPVDCKQTSVGGVVRDAVEMVRGAATAASLAIDVELSEGTPDVWADRDRLLQVLENLLGNAVKFTGPGGRVAVCAGPREDEVLFRVTDSGMGIEPQQVSHLFEPFWQARKGDVRGAGLGLPIVKGIVDSHRGRVWVESTPKRGSTFFFTIPTRAEPSQLL